MAGDQWKDVLGVRRRCGPDVLRRRSPTRPWGPGGPLVRVLGALTLSGSCGRCLRGLPSSSAGPTDRQAAGPAPSQQAGGISVTQ